MDIRLQASIAVALLGNVVPGFPVTGLVTGTRLTIDSPPFSC